MVTGAPGHTNSITGIATANATGSPVVAVSGMSHSALRDRNAFQDMDQLPLVRGITKYAAVPAHASQIPLYVRRAFAAAATGRGGAAHLSVPGGRLYRAGGKPRSPTRRADSSSAAFAGRGPAQPSGRPDPASRKAVVIAGSGAWWSDAGAELEAFIEKASLPLFTICLARGIVSDSHPLCFGYADPTLNRAAEKVCRQADLVLVLGKRLDYRLRLGGPQLFSSDAKFVQVDVHSPELGLNRRLEVALLSDVKAALRSLLDELGNEGPPDRSAWLAEIRRARQAWDQELAAIASQPSQPMHPLHFFMALRDEIPSDATLCWDGGDFVHWGRVRFRPTSRCIGSGWEPWPAWE